MQIYHQMVMWSQTLEEGVPAILTKKPVLLTRIGKRMRTLVQVDTLKGRLSGDLMCFNINNKFLMFYKEIVLVKLPR